jgi:copper chaperone CopZ
MRKLIVLIALIVCAISNAQDYTVLHINSSWNSRNDYKQLNKLKGVRIVKANLEDQQPSIRRQIKAIRRQIKAIPVIFIYKDNNVIGRWDADISLSIKAPVEELQEVIDNSKYTRVATN